MVEVLDSWPDGLHVAGKYPWDEWMDGRVRRAQRGLDYDCTTRNFQVQLRQAASRRALTLRSRRIGESVVFSFQPREGQR